MDHATSAQRDWGRIQDDAPPAAHRDYRQNVHGIERTLSTAAGLLLFGRGLVRGGLVGVLEAVLGGSLFARGLTGRCAAKRLLTGTPFEAQVAAEHGWHSAAAITRSITIGRPRDEVYAYWRDFTNLANFMEHIERIDVLDARRSRWVVKAPMGQTVEWVSHIIDEKAGERIAWETEYDADVRSTGWVEFRDAPGERGTEVRAMIAYEPPGGRIGHFAARLWREDPTSQTHDDLRRLKQILETGEVTTSAVKPQ